MAIHILHAAALCLALVLPAAAMAGTPGEASLEERFQRLDRDGDGFITWDEARPQREAEHRRLDRDGDGALTSAEFGDRALPIGDFDADGDGRVSLAEYLAKHREMFQKADQDSDGRISLREFIKVQQAVRGGKD